jgi:peptidoglycan/xylan/chitin deacetylase (PgdA/CDA1 family)
VKYALNHIKSTLGLNKKLFQDTPGSRIVIYHGICQNDPTLINSLFVTAKTFGQHLQFYRRHFDIISLEDHFAGRFSKDRFSICLTFDDGFANNYRHALPLLDRYQAPATFFITAIRQAGYDILWNDQLALLQRFGPSRLTFNGISYGRDRHRRYVPETGGPGLREYLQKEGFPQKANFIQQTAEMILPGKASAGKDYWLQMTEEEISRLGDSPYATIGCHGYYHNDLAQIPLSEAIDEVTHCRQYLQKITGRKTESIAFPYGAYTQELIPAVNAAGFTQLLAVDFLYPGDAAHPLMRERMTINPYISVYNQMTAIVRGQYNF